MLSVLVFDIYVNSSMENQVDINEVICFLALVTLLTPVSLPVQAVRYCLPNAR
jgi:hypothetical protein